jgi:hypothetical protein
LGSTLLGAAAIALSLTFLVTPAGATPKAGTRELRLEQHYQPPVDLIDGLVHVESQGRGVTGMGLGVGWGTFHADTVELGVSVSLGLLKFDDDDPTVAMGVEPFARFIKLKGRVGYFIELVAGFKRLTQAGDGLTNIDLGADFGLELFMTETWAVRISPGYRWVLYGGNDLANAYHRLGVTWGLACYY